MTQKYETREQYLNAFVEYARPHFERVERPLPERIRVSIGFTSKGRRGNVIGETWDDSASTDGYFEIFVSPKVESVAAIAHTLTLQLCHAAVGVGAGYGPLYRACALALGFTGQMRSPKASSDFFLWALPILEELGDMPYGNIKEAESTPKQNTNLRKMTCDECGFIIRTTRKWIDRHSHLDCPAPDCEGTLIEDGAQA